MGIVGVPLFGLPPVPNMDLKINFALLRWVFSDIGPFMCWVCFFSLMLLALLTYVMIYGGKHIFRGRFLLQAYWVPTIRNYGRVGLSWGGLGSCGGLPHNSHSGFPTLWEGRIFWGRNLHTSRLRCPPLQSPPLLHPDIARRAICISPNTRGPFSFQA